MTGFSASDVLELVLGPPAAVAAGTVRAFLDATALLAAPFSRPVDRAIALATAADRLGFAFAAGYEAALAALVPSLPAGAVASFCVTESGGNHPRAIETRLEPSGTGWVVTGEKKWSTMAPLADVLVVVAKEGTDAEGRPVLRAVQVERSAQHLVVKEMPAPPFVPEVPHAELSLAGVLVPADAVLPGDGFSDYAKAFRTVEDLHVNAAVLGYLASVCARHALPSALRERAAALIVAVRELAARDPKSAVTHVAIAGFLAEGARFVADVEAAWTATGDAEHERWQRDRALVHVAGKAREQRRARAWERLSGEGTQ